MKWEHRIEKMRNELRARAYRFFGFLQVCHGMTYSINYTVSISWDTLTRDVSRVGRKFVKVFRACIQNYIIFRATIVFRSLCPPRWLLWVKSLIFLQLNLKLQAHPGSFRLLGLVSLTFWINTRWSCVEKTNHLRDSWLVLRNDFA